MDSGQPQAYTPVRISVWPILPPAREKGRQPPLSSAPDRYRLPPRLTLGLGASSAVDADSASGRRRRRIRPPWTSAPAPPRPWMPTPTATWTPRPGPPPPSTPPPGPHPPSTPPSPRSWQARVQAVRIRGRLSLSSNAPSAKRRLLSTGARMTTSTTEEGSPSHRMPSCSHQRKGLNQMAPDGIIDIY